MVFYIPIKFRVYGDLCTYPAGSPCRQWKPWDLEARVRRVLPGGRYRVRLADRTDASRRRRPAEVIYAPDDSHWNAEGQRFVAEQLARLAELGTGNYRN